MQNQKDPNIARIDRIKVHDVVTEEDLLETIMRELKGIVIKNSSLLKMVLKDSSGISVDTCHELLQAVEERLNEAGLTEVGA